jgi:hypothetical protein
MTVIEETLEETLEPLKVNGFAVHPGLLEARPIRRCNLDECQAHCCGWGVSIQTKQVDDILAHQELIKPHLPPDRREAAKWFDGELEPEEDHPAGGMVNSTSVVEDPTHPTGHNCVFLRPDRKCALQVAGIAAGEHPWRFKPFYCALHPITFDTHVIQLDQENELYVEGGSCNRPDPGHVIPLYQLFDVEMKLAIGEEGYAELEALARARA